ncbi:MAG: ABC transporter permease [Terracidiphilus sp.]
MALNSRLKSAVRNLLHKERVETELDAEIRAYVEAAADEKIVAGMTESEARRSALAEIGGMEPVKQAVRDHRAGANVELLWQDVRYGLRQLRRNPVFAWTAVITLALGIGATTTIFSAVYSLMIRPLPYSQAGELMSVSSHTAHAPGDLLMSPDFVAAQEDLKSFQQFAGYYWRNRNLTSPGEPMRVDWVGVTANFLPMLGVVPQLGRNILPNEDRPGGPAVVLLSDRLWQSQFHGDRGVVGKTVVLDGTAETIIGVLPPHFIFPDLDFEPDVFAPIDLDRDTSLSVYKPVLGINTIARLREGVSREQAQAEVQAFFEGRARNYPAAFASWVSGRKIIVEPLQRHLTGDDRKPLLILLASVAVVLLISCANVANLQLARAVSRRHETALRGAMGASRLRIVRQLLIESLLLSLLAAALGLAIAFIGTSLIRSANRLDASQAAVHSLAAQALRLPFGKLSGAIQVDGWVLAFAVGLAVLTTLLFGLAPAIGSTRTDLRKALQSAALRITSGREQRLLRHGLLVLEVGLAVVLLSCSGLLIRSFVNVLHYDAGFDPSQTLTAETLLSGSRYSSLEDLQGFADRLLPRLQALPGVQAAALTGALPLGPAYGTQISFENNPNPPLGLRHDMTTISVTPDYFRAVGTPLIAGRPFDKDDNASSNYVAIVNRAFARAYFGGNAVGKHFRVGEVMNNHHEMVSVTVIGVAEDVRHNGLEQEVHPECFVPMAQLPDGYIDFVLRTTTDPESLANAMRKAVLAVDPQQPLFDVETMDERIADSLAQRRLIMLLIAGFALLAIVLSAVGVYGVFAYSVSQRTQEMGIRLALGASRGGLLRLVIQEAAGLIFIGSTFGIGAALLLSRLLASALVGITPHDALSYSSAWVLMTTVALLASSIPAADAARTDLISVLRSE